MDTKACTRCNESKTLDLFGIDQRRKDGHTSSCRTCLNDAARSKYTPKKKPLGDSKICKDCTEDLPLENFRKGTASNGKQYYQSYCKNCMKIRKRKEYHANPEHYRAKKREEYWENPEDFRIRMRDWQRNNRDKLRVVEANNKKMRRAAFVERIEFLEVWNRDKGTCQLCGKLLSQETKFPDWESPTIDHIVPIAKGGTHEYANVQLTCWRCNHSKADSLLDLER